MTAPIESEADAGDREPARAIYALADQQLPGWREAWNAACADLLEQAAGDAELTPYERRTIRTLSDEPYRCATIARILEAVYEAGLTAREDGGDE